MCGYFCIEFIDFILKGKILLDYTNLFSSNKYQKDDETMLEYFQELTRLRWKNSIKLFVVSIENLRTLKYHTFSKKTLEETTFFPLFAKKVKMKTKKYFKHKNQFRY